MPQFLSPFVFLNGYFFAIRGTKYLIKNNSQNLKEHVWFYVFVPIYEREIQFFY